MSLMSLFLNAASSQTVQNPWLRYSLIEMAVQQGEVFREPLGGVAIFLRSEENLWDNYNNNNNPFISHRPDHDYSFIDKIYILTDKMCMIV
jgi:hypothetical protein